jgi:hypothetical protein
MSKWLMRGHFGHLHFKTFPMTPRAFKCKEIWPLQLCSEFLGVPEDSNFPLLGVWASPSHLAQSGVATQTNINVWIHRSLLKKHYHLKGNNNCVGTLCQKFILYVYQNVKGNEKNPPSKIIQNAPQKSTFFLAWNVTL